MSYRRHIRLLEISSLGKLLFNSIFCLLSTVYCLFLFIATPSLSASDGWATTYGGADDDKAYSVQQARDGGYIVAGITNSFGAGGYDAWVLKLRADGSVEWQKTYGGVKEDGAFSIRQTRNGGYVVAGQTESFGAGERDIWVLKLRADGTVEWQKTYGGAKVDGLNCIQQTRDGGYIIAGWTISFSDNRWGEAWVLKLRADGTVEWQKTYGGVMHDNVDYLQQTKDSGYIMAGWTGSFGTGLDDFWVLKLRADGTVEWQRAYGGSGSEVARAIQQTSEGGYIVAGMTGSFGLGQTDIWVLKLSSDGMLEWQESYGGAKHDWAHAIQQTSDGGYIVGGWRVEELALYERFTTVEVKSWVLKLREDGTVEWQKTYKRGSNWLNRLYSIQQTRDGGYIAAGDAKPLSKDWDFLVFKLRSDGSIGPSYEFVKETDIAGIFSNARITNTTASPIDSSAIPQDSLATVQDTNASVDIFCPPTTVKP